MKDNIIITAILLLLLVFGVGAIFGVLMALQGL